jgi:DNA (cytosine-5)-methyltransferase 1
LAVTPTVTASDGIGPDEISAGKAAVQQDLFAAGDWDLGVREPNPEVDGASAEPWDRFVAPRDDSSGGEDDIHPDLFAESDKDLLPVEVYRWGVGDTIVRAVARRDGSVVETVLSANRSLLADQDPGAAFDHVWLTSIVPPVAERADAQSIRIADLFCGCGGLTLGAVEACRALGLQGNPVFAVDKYAAALEVYKSNFPLAQVDPSPIEKLLDSDLGRPPSDAERRLVEELGRIDLLVGGPPCQGHSNLNNRTRRRDGRNLLYMRMARFAELFEPEHVGIENVVGVHHDKTDERAFSATWRFLREELGYFVDGDIIRTDAIGVAQRRPRILLVASKTVPVKVRALEKRFRTSLRDFAWACGDLMDEVPTRAFDRARTPTGITARRIDYLHEHDLYGLPNELRPRCHQNGHTYPSVYGRLRGDQPAPTITTGFMTMGQGRFVHPQRRRTLTPHEGARLQFFPDWFDFGERSRKDFLTLIGNAVPPKLAYVVTLELLR